MDASTPGGYNGYTEGSIHNCYNGYIDASIPDWYNGYIVAPNLTAIIAM
jgi:hypothetical protein